MTDTLALRKARGAFFTPPEIAQFIASWAVRSPTDTVLEPSAGEASFLLAASARLRSLGASLSATASHLSGVELHAPSAMAAETLLRDAGVSTSIQVGDFFDVEPAATYDAVIGNPPYIRYHNFAGENRLKGMRAALAEGVRLTGLASAWAPFTIHAARFLAPRGRLGLVLPAELLTVNYAAEVRRFLLNRFASVRLVMFEELLFPGVLEDVVLLLAEGQGPAPSGSFEVFQARDVSELTGLEERATWTWFTPEGDGKWSPALLSESALDTYRSLEEGGGFEPLAQWGTAYLGCVTGNNRFFALTRPQAKSLGLHSRDLLRISPPGSRHLRGLTFSADSWAQLADESAGYLFWPHSDELSKSALEHIRAGELAGVDQGYKCRMRRPWWRVPLVKVPDLFLTYMDHERPRIVTNEARALHLNSLYGVLLERSRRKLGRDLLPLALLNSVTLLSGEMVGRAYGGGLLKLEPREADRLLVPSIGTLDAIAPELRRLRPQVGKALRRGALDEAVQLVDRVLFTRHLGTSSRNIAAIRKARMVLFSRRTSRAARKGGRGKS